MVESTTMKKFFLVSSLSAALALGAVAGCNSPWWQQVQANPAAAVQQFETAAQVAIDGAQIAWATIMPLLPPATAQAINSQFLKAISSVNHALQVLNDAVVAAEAAKQSNPDFTALMQAVSDAVGQVIAIIQTYVSMPATADAGAADAAPAGAGPKLIAADACPGYADLISAQASMKRFTGK
jgi:hypothetical protein